MTKTCQELKKDILLGNFSNLMAEDLTEDVRKTVLPLTIFIVIEAAFGFFGNVLILYVYLQKYPKCNFRTFVLFISFTDLTSCITTLPGEAFTQWNWYSFEDYEWICKIKSFFNVYTACNSGLALLFLAFDRYRKVCRPLEWQIRSRVALRACILATGLSALVATPFFFLWGAQKYKMEIRGVIVEVTACEKDERYENTLYPKIYTSIAFIAPVIIGMVITAILSILVVKKIFCNMKGLPEVGGRMAPNASRWNKYSLRKTASEYCTDSKTHLTESFYSSANSYSAPDLCKGVGFINFIDNGHDSSITPRVQKSYLTDKSGIRTSIHMSLRTCRISLFKRDKQRLPGDIMLRNDKRYNSFSSIYDFRTTRVSILDSKGDKVDSKSANTTNQRCVFYIPEDGSSCDIVGDTEHIGLSEEALDFRRTSSDNGMALQYAAHCFSPSSEIPSEIVLNLKRGPDKLKDLRSCVDHLVFKKRKLCPLFVSTSDRDLCNLHKTICRPSEQFSDESRVGSIKVNSRIQRKTLIMLILTSVFVVTFIVYLTLVSFIATSDKLQKLTNEEKLVYFFFLRLYFVNCVINPILYGFLDPRFRNGIKDIFRKMVRVSSSPSCVSF